MIERLKIILDYYNLTSSNFAEKIDVPKSSISHLLSGRNKPSLDFIIKVDKAFDEIDLDWLLYGKGNFPSKNDEPTSLFNQDLKKSPEEEVPSISEVNFEKPEKVNNLTKSPPKILTKIILLYNDGTFDVFDK